jgi:hypothetical protein
VNGEAMPALDKVQMKGKIAEVLWTCQQLSGPLRVIDASAGPRLLADLGSAPPPAAISAWPGGHRG